ncbi:MAG: redoxin domain-containing protein [Geobacter sp.]|nr:redoxin domain-containing protein [Geobacter sp.]
MKNLIYLCLLFATVTYPITGSAATLPGHSETSQDSVSSNTSSTWAEIGSPAPLFTLDAVVNQEFKKISLADYRGKWVVLFFYPGDFTFVCPTEIRGFNKSLAEFTKLNAAVLAASVDSKYSHMAWIKSGALDKLEFPLLSDFSKQTARSYGVLDEVQSSARRGLFIIDPNGVVQHMLIHNDKVGRSVEETLRVLKALQTQELCPINWKPGDKTIKH